MDAVASAASLATAGFDQAEVSADFWETNSQPKLIWMTPPLFATARIMSSVMLRGMFERARQEEWELKTGDFEVSITSQNVLSETWAMSIIIPRRFISAMTSRPNGLRPALVVSALDPAQPVSLVWVRVM